MSLRLGTTRNGNPLALTDEQRSRHIHVIGASGTGKSKLLEAMIRQDILAGRGLCLIDPHGKLADDIVQWCSALRIGDHRRVHVIDPKDRAWAAGFNPLRMDDAGEIVARVDAMVATCAEVWGGEDINQTPLLTTCLQLVFYALAVNELTLVEAVELTSSSDPEAIRARLTKNLPDSVYDAYWRDFLGLSKKDFEERFSSTRRRLLRFLGSRVVRRIVGQRLGVLDLRQVMDEGDIVIVNLVPRGNLSEENARLLGALLTSELRLAALSRDQAVADRMPFSLYIDECYQFLTGDVEKMLDQTRKFGLHAVLAHQRLGQLGEPDSPIRNGVMAGGQTKVVFGGMTDDDAEVMAREVYRSTFKLERPKHVLDKLTVVDDVPYWLESEGWSDSESITNSATDSGAWGRSVSASAAHVETYDSQGRGPFGPVRLTTGVSTAASESGGWSTGLAHTTGRTSTHGRAQTLKPVRAMMPTAVYSVEDEKHLAIVKLRELPNQAAIVKRRGHPPVRVRPATVNAALAWPELIDGFLDDTRAASPYITSTEAADAEIAARRGALRPASTAALGERADRELFWSDQPE
jgi:hypothetical protein